MAWNDIKPFYYGEHINKTWREIWKETDVQTVFTRGNIVEPTIQKLIPANPTKIDNTPKNTKEEMFDFRERCDKIRKEILKSRLDNFNSERRGIILLIYHRNMKLKREGKFIHA